MNSTKFRTATPSRITSSTKRSYASVAVVTEPEMQQAKAVSDTTMDQLATQMRANLIRNVAEAKGRPAGDPADWEI